MNIIDFTCIPLCTFKIVFEFTHVSIQTVVVKFLLCRIKYNEMYKIKRNPTEYKKNGGKRTVL